jgi:hypothetical protein
MKSNSSSNAFQYRIEKKDFSDKDNSLLSRYANSTKDFQNLSFPQIISRINNLEERTRDSIIIPRELSGSRCDEEELQGSQEYFFSPSPLNPDTIEIFRQLGYSISICSSSSE